MKRELKNASDQIFLTVEFDGFNGWIYANWSGFQTLESVMQGANTFLEVLTETHCPYLFNDNRLVAGPWSQAAEWIVQNWTPRAMTQGLTHFAHVISPESLARLSAENLRNRISSSLQMQIFDDAEKAKEWLKQAQKKSQ